MKKKIAYAAMSVLLMMSLCACAGKEPKDQEKGFLYYINSEKNGIEKESYHYSGETAADMVGQILKGLTEVPDDIEHMPAIPKDVEILDWELEGGELRIDFNDQYKKMHMIEETLTRSAIVLSVLQVPKVERVLFFVDSIPLTNDQNEEIGYMDENSFVRNTGETLNSYQTATLKLYFANESGEQLVEETRDVKYSSNTSVEKLIVEQLMKGPAKTGAYPVVNPLAKVLSVSVRESVCYVNFDDEFLNSAYDVRPEVTIYALVNSLVEGGNCVQVQILINGETNAAYKETISLSNPFGRDVQWIESRGEE